MAQTPSRNAPCPCGSGKKYKHCHAGQQEEIVKQSNTRLFKIAIPVGVVAGIGVGISQGFITGIAVAVGVVMMAGLVLIFRNPPPPSGSGKDPAGLGFGR